MLLLLALPVLLTVVLVHRYLQTYAPSNVLARRVRSTQPRARTAAGLLALACVLLIAMHAAAVAAATGAPGWLNLVVIVLAWDALKVAWLAVGALVRTLIGLGRRMVGRPAKPLQPSFYS